MNKKVIASSWGNSIGIRFPKKMAEELKIEDGTELTCELRNGKIILYRADAKFSKSDQVEEAIEILQATLPKSKINK